MALCQYVIMNVPLFIIVIMAVLIIVIPTLADDCGCSDTGDGASDSGSDSSDSSGSSGDTIMILVTQGRIMFAEGRYNESLTAYRDALAVNPNDASAWSGTGDALYELGNYTAAVEAYDHHGPGRGMHFLQRVRIRMQLTRMIGRLQ
jgi:predicted Zn-dependent protease